MNKYYIGVDLAYKPSWWKRLLVWLHLRRRDWDYSAMTIWKKDKDGNMYLIDPRVFEV